MATIVTRQGKGSPLTFVEVDANFTNLNDDVTALQSSAGVGGTIDTRLDALESTDVATDGRLDVLEAYDTAATARFLDVENSLVYFAATKSAGDTLASSLPDGATVIVTADESQGGVRVRYTVASAALTAGVVDTAVMSQFTQSGTSAVARTAQDKMREVVSVKDFGAVGDGVTDDTAAIQAALSTGKDVFLPMGEYAFSSFNAGSQRFYGEGTKSILKLIAAPLATPAITLGDDSSITKLLIDAPFANVGPALISATSKSNILFEDVCIKNWRGNIGLFFTSCALVKINRCKFDGVNAAVRVITSSRVWVSFCDFYVDRLNNPTGVVSDPVYFENGSDYFVDNNYIDGSCRDGIVFEGSGISNFSISNNIVKNVAESGIWLETAHQHGVISSNAVSNCLGLVYGLGQGITMAFSKNVSCTGNEVRDCKKGIYADTASVVISSNAITNCSEAGISLDGNAEAAAFIVSGNSVGFSNYGLLTNIVRNIKITNNLFHKNVKSGVRIQSLIRDSEISNNHFMNNNTGSAASGDDAASLCFASLLSNGVFQTSIACNKFIGGAIGIRISGDEFASVDSFVFANYFDSLSGISYDLQSRPPRIFEAPRTAVRYGSAAPTAGLGVQGDIVYNTAPVASGFIGFVCVSSGLPGTWKTFGPISA